MQEFKSGAKKDTSNKLPLHLVPPEVEEIFALVSEIGLKKGYPPRNWEKGLPICEGHLAALKRHMKEYEKGIDYNSEKLLDGTSSHEPHLYHLAWHAMAAAVQFSRGRTDLDDRPTTKVLDDNLDKLYQEIFNGEKQNG